MLVQNPEEANLLHALDPELWFRPPRYYLVTTGPLEGAALISK